MSQASPVSDRITTFVVHSGKYPFHRLGVVEAKDAKEAIAQVKGNWHRWHEVRPAVRSLTGDYEAAVESSAFDDEEA